VTSRIRITIAVLSIQTLDCWTQHEKLLLIVSSVA